MRYKVRYQWGKKGGCVTVEAEDDDEAIAMVRDSMKERPGGRNPEYYSFQVEEVWEEDEPPPEDDCPPWWTERGVDVNQRSSR